MTAALSTSLTTAQARHSPLRRRLRLEWRLLGGSRHLALLLALLLVLSAIAGLRGGQWVEHQHEAIRASQAHDESTDQEHQRMAARIRAGVAAHWYQNALNAQAHSYLIVRHAGLPPRVTGFFSAGQSDLHPWLHRVLPHPRERWAAQQEYVHPWQLALGRFDLAFIIVWLLPLLAIALLAPAVAAERESRRLGLLMVEAGSAGQFLRARLLLRGGVALALALAVLVAGGLAAGFRPQSAADLADALALGGLTLAYVLLWCSLAVAVSAYAGSLRAALLTLGTLWLVLTLAVPLLLEAGARLRHPGNTALEDFLERRAIVEQARDREMDLLRQYLAEHVNLAENPNAARMLEPGTVVITQTNLLVDRATRPAIQALDARARALTEAREGFIAAGAWAAPGYALWQGLSALSGTAASRYRAFEQQLMHYHGELATAFFADVMRRAELQTPVQAPHFAFEDVPREPARTAAWRLMRLWLLLAGAALLSAGVALHRRPD